MSPAPWMTVAAVAAIAAVAAAAVLGVGAFARAVAERDRRRALGVLAQVREALSRRRPDEARRLLPQAFFMPISGRYQPADAAVALDVLDAFEDTLAAYRLSGAVLTRDLRGALKHSASRGVAVPWRLIASFMDVLRAVAPADAPLYQVLRRGAARVARERGERRERQDVLREARLLARWLAPATIRSTWRA